MSKFNRCTTRKKTKDGYSVECKLGLWGVTMDTNKIVRIQDRTGAVVALVDGGIRLIDGLNYSFDEVETGEKPKPLQLQCKPDNHRDVFWHDDEIMQEFFDKGVDIQDEKVLHLVKELDRRFIQLWDKVKYERKD